MLTIICILGPGIFGPFGLALLRVNSPSHEIFSNAREFTRIPEDYDERCPEKEESRQRLYYRKWKRKSTLTVGKIWLVDFLVISGLSRGSSRASHRLTLDLWLAKDNRFLNPKSSYERILTAPPCRLILRQNPWDRRSAAQWLKPS